jgi:hypothetical protein
MIAANHESKMDKTSAPDLHTFIQGCDDFGASETLGKVSAVFRLRRPDIVATNANLEYPPVFP